MAITVPQRKLAIGLVVTAAVSNPTQLTALIPGATPDGVLSAIATAVGAAQDANLTIALANYVIQLQAQQTGFQSGLTNVQAEITAATVV